MTLTIREGGPGDAPVILGMLDSAVEWLVSQGRTGQWGREPWSTDPAAVAVVERYVTDGTPYVAEFDGVPAASLTLTDGPAPYLEPADEPERYIHLFATDRRFRGRGAGAALLAHAAEVTRRAGISLLRVDCYAGDDGKLVAYYERNGFIRTEPYTHGEDAWLGQVLARRVL
ncbi:GNAT family N-acetyltransferase [Streptomyces actinomycinicus]|uniref:GNAT family N-acetyltransferase n=1 Tax=Streptomyces actinomycinicus TaxID=1695166 RepID=A0A937JJX2_9ACTN|nr:GNAT family N-acetyltransferase [Streptomyces actinomycinicus]MBL1081894.1 GNAT family N-acetyltransferase [Streptomyces actinomycinicus]